MTKLQRHSRILELIKNNDIQTQEELTSKLADLGFDVTQATVSRDIKSLQIIKTIGENGRYKYTTNSREDEVKNTAKFHDILSGIVLSATAAGNIVVVKTYNGMANAAAAAIDAMMFDDIVGSIAGDDTIFLVVSTPSDAKAIKDKLYELLNNR